MMIKLITCILNSSLLFCAAACANISFSKKSEKVKCAVAGIPDPKTAADYFKRAMKRGEEADLSDDAIECIIADCSAALSLEPENFEALALRGTSYLRKMDYESALADMDEAIRLEPKFTDSFYIRSLIYTDQGLIGKALKDLDSFIELAVSFEIADDEVFSDRADIYFAMGDYKNAIKDYKETVARKRDNPEHYRNLAKAHRQLSKYESRDIDRKSAMVLAKSFEKKAEELEVKAKKLPQDPVQTVPTEGLAGGVLNIKAIDLPDLVIPTDAKAAIADGSVILSVEIDEKGNLTSARTISGHQLLRSAAEEAAKGVKFESIIFGGKPVKVYGILVFNFAPASVNAKDKQIAL